MSPLRGIMESCPAATIAIMAAPADSALARLARELGIDGRLTKPIHPDALPRVKAGQPSMVRI